MEEQRNQKRPVEMEKEQRNRQKPAEMEKQHQQQRNQMKPAETEKEQQQRQQREEEEDKPREKRREQEQTLQNHSVSVPTPSPSPSVNTQSSESYKDPKRRSPSSDSPLSSDNSSLSHGSSPRGPPQSQPSYPSYPNCLPPVSYSNCLPPVAYPNSLPPVSTVADVKVGSESPDFVATVEVEEPKINSGSSRRLRPDLSILRRTKRERMVKRVLLGFRTCGFACCLVAFSVLAADKDQGWALDSFYRYREFRYSMAVTVIGFVYSAFQAYGLAYGLATSEQKTRPRLRYYLDFSLDQIISYLLLSASSSAAVRVDDWQSNWGEDKFPEMAKASVALSFIAFISMALSSVVSGYTLCTLKSI